MNFQNEQGHICKPRSGQEAQFYNHLHDKFHCLLDAVPKCHGQFTLVRDFDQVFIGQTHSFSTNLVDEAPVDPFGKEYVAIENITQGMTKPCLIDIKLASKPYNPKKIAR